MKTAWAIFLTVTILQGALFALEPSRMVLTRDIRDNEPADSDTVFFLVEGGVYCFTEFLNVPKTTRIFHRWYCNSRQVASIPLTLQPSKRWRTWSRKAFQGCTGEWMVRIFDHRDKVIAEMKFQVRTK